MSRFNLIDEQWIPVRFPDGSRAEMGIQDALLRAREIASIEDPSPLVVAALHRFLLAVGGDEVCCRAGFRKSIQTY